MMLPIKKILFFLCMCMTTSICAQTAGFNYQALILNTAEIEIPGTDVTESKVPLRSEEIRLQFTITSEAHVEYSEEHRVTTDENGMISLIVGEGTPLISTFENIRWDGKPKHLNVAINIVSTNEGFVFLDAQKILYLPYPKNELTLMVVEDDVHRETVFKAPKSGAQVWNESCDCVEVFNGLVWVSQISNGTNGISKTNGTLVLGGALTQATEIRTTNTNTLAIKGLSTSLQKDSNVLVSDTISGILKQMPISYLQQKTQIEIVSEAGQLEFKTPKTITSIHKIDVYRNGIRVEFSAINATTIKLEPEAICFKNDKIKIVQLY